EQEMVDITGADLVPDRRELIEVRKLPMRNEVRNAVPHDLYEDWVAAIADRTGLGPGDMYPRLVAAVVRAVGDTAMEAYANADPPVAITGLMRAGFDAVVAGLPEPNGTKE
ncbi:MAG: TetR family transcriptional regulator, partial [Actinobacteria bacterium]|nr:TetR family transcriptional regulator [Actinomycetota bacterium]